MLTNTTNRGWLPRSLFIATVAWTFAQASPAFAVINCNSGVTFSTNTTLSDNYEQTVSTSTPCITLTNGADLDFNGKKLTCKAGTIGGCSVGVRATAASSYITNGTPLNKAITADSSSAWDVGIDDVEGVEKLRIELAVTGITGDDLLYVRNNAITIVDACVEATMPHSFSVLNNVLCQPNMRDQLGLGWGDRLGIDVTGTTTGTGPLVSRNFVTHPNVGIVGSDRVRFEDNIITELVGSNTTGIRIDSTQTQTGSHNLCCDVPDNDADDCDYSTEESGAFTLWP